MLRGVILSAKTLFEISKFRYIKKDNFAIFVIKLQLVHNNLEILGVQNFKAVLILLENEPLSFA